LQQVNESSFQTLEALATLVAKIATKEFLMESVTVKAEKPSAQAFVECSGVEIKRTMSDFR
jgi:dihydroneopterin aldolase